MGSGGKGKRGREREGEERGEDGAREEPDGFLIWVFLKIKSNLLRLTEPKF